MAKLETRKRILKAAEELFSRNGFDGVATKLIASEAGVTEMTLFNHFNNKKHLYKTVVKERYDAAEIIEVLSEVTYEDLEKDLLLIAGKLIERYWLNKNILMMRMKEKESFHNDKSFKMEQDPILAQILPVFESYESKGKLRGSSKETALTFLASMKGLLYVSLLDEKNEAEVKIMIESFVVGICYGYTK